MIAVQQSSYLSYTQEYQVLAEHLSVFIASIDLIVTNADDRVTENEIEFISQNLVNLQIIPYTLPGLRCPT